MKRAEQELVFSPKPGATPDEIMEILRLVMFQTYPVELRTRETLTALFNNLSEKAQRHFEVKDP